MIGFVSSSFTFLNALSWSGPHNQADFLLRSCRRGWVRSDRFWENLPSWFTIPMKRRISVILVGGSMSVMADVFFEAISSEGGDESGEVTRFLGQRDLPESTICISLLNICDPASCASILSTFGRGCSSRRIFLFSGLWSTQIRIAPSFLRRYHHHPCAPGCWLVHL